MGAPESSAARHAAIVLLVTSAWVLGHWLIFTRVNDLGVLGYVLVGQLVYGLILGAVLQERSAAAAQGIFIGVAVTMLAPIVLCAIFPPRITTH